MVKTPRTRHSKAKRSPVTIELEPGAVSRVKDRADEGPDTKPQEPVHTSEAEPDDRIPTEPPAPLTDDITERSTTDPLANAAERSDSGETHSEDVSGNDFSSESSDTSIAGEPDGQANAPVAEARKGSSFPVIAAGVIGGMLALAGAGALQFAGIMGTPSQPGGPAPDVGQIEQDISGLKAELSALKENAGVTDPSAVDGLAQKLEQLQAEVASLQKAIESGDAGDSAGLEALGTRLDEMQAKISAVASENASGVSPAEVAEISDKVIAVEALAKAAGEANSAIDGKLGAIEQRLDGLAAKVEAQAEQPKIALSIASAALKSAIERGVPFKSEIETFAAISPESPEIADLRKYAENGVATRAEILAETDAAASAMIAAALPPKQDAGIFERLLSSAESLVTVRPIGAVPGTGVPETVARMEVALQAGDLGKALEEYDTLPEPARTAGAAFADKVRARLEVERLVDQAVSSAMKAE